MHRASRLISVFLASIAAATLARAQTTPGEPPALDPASPMADLPDLGVSWPDVRPADVAPAAPGSTDAKCAGVPSNAGTNVDSATERRYHVQIEGLDNVPQGAIKTRFDEGSALHKSQGEPANTAQIDRRAHDDEDLLEQLLRSYGYYDATVSTRVEKAADDRLNVILTAEPGQLFHFVWIDITGLESGGPAAVALRPGFALKPQDAIDADQIVTATAALKVRLNEEGYPFAKVGEPHIVVDHDTHTGTLTLAVEPGGREKIGQIRIEGKRVFSANHLATIARFRPGAFYNSTRIEDFRRALIATGLVSSVQIRPVQTADPDVVDIGVKIDAAPPRTIAGELGYGTGEGARAQISWTHRNLIRPEGAVTFSGVAGTQEQSLGATIRRSNFHQRDQLLTSQVLISHTKRDAYDARTLTLSTSLEKQTNIIWQKKWTWSIGGEFLASDERDTIVSTGQPRRRTFLIGAVPTSLSYDGTDNLLDPTRGFRLSGHLSPEVSLQAGAFGYLRSQIDASAYWPVTDRIVIAGRTRVASIAGAGRDRIAPSRRYYAGGGGSVRGYGYQDIGPKDVNGDPVGGRSLAEFSIESRIRFGNFGVVPFLDAGNLYNGALPTFTGLRYGTGLGFRYYTSFGPIRIDLGTPIGRRPGEPKVSIYISLGQAF